jgi:histidine triad (HIT) family protein
MKRDPNCLFCKIVAGEGQANFIDQRPYGVAIRDINPQAPDHVLIIPTDHVTSLNDCNDGTLLGELMMMAREVARKVNVDHGGYRVVVNTGKHGGQTVDQLHLHLLGGRRMAWPPG